MALSSRGGQDRVSGTFGQEGELIYVTSQGSQLAVKALELALESFAQPCFACCEYDLFWHGESMDRNHTACFRNLLFVGRSVGQPFGRTVRTSE